MLRGATLSGLAIVAVASGGGFAPATSTFAQEDDSRALRIDGRSPERFAASLAALQTALPAGEREELETALAIVWLTNASNGGDIDRDGQLEPDDLRELQTQSADLLEDINRGDLVATVEKLDARGGDYTSADYFAALDGLGYDGVLELAGRAREAPEITRAVRAYKAQILCRDVWSAVRRKWCDAFFRSHDAPSADALFVPQVVPTEEALATAREALKEGDTATAASALNALDGNRLTPFETGMAEALRFYVAYRRKLYPEAREHLQAAVDVQIMTPADAQAILDVLDHFEAMATRPR
jgi:hypothetical protein